MPLPEKTSLPKILSAFTATGITPAGLLSPAVREWEANPPVFTQGNYLASAAGSCCVQAGQDLTNLLQYMFQMQQ